VKRAFVLILYLHVFIGYSQEDKLVDNVLLSLRSYESQQTEKQIEAIKNKKSSAFLSIELNDQKEGVLDTVFLYKITKSETKTYSNREQMLYNYTLGDALYKYNKNDSLAYYYYLKSLEKAKENNDSAVANHVLKKVNSLIFKNPKDLVLFKKYTEAYKQWAKSDIDKFWAQYYFIAYQFFYLESIMTFDEINLNADFELGYTYADNDYLKAVLQQLQGIYFDVIKKDNKNAELNYNMAITNYTKYNHYEAKSGMFGVKVNLGIILYNSGQYSNAISVFKKALQTSITSNHKIDKLYINDWLYKSYEKLKQYDSAHFYFKEMSNIKQELDQLNHAKGIKIIDAKYNYEKKEKELKKLAKKNTELQQNVYTLLPILGVISLVLLLVYFLYRRYRKKSSTLEVEKSETLKKLDELKQIVIKNHIILKDKTKIYIADLLYIKSDDHYLNVFLHEGKDHFVRGKLNQIIEELPPNFIRCHRSYIVNRNFIKQINNDTIVLIDKTMIPLSRSYKDKI